MKLFRDTHSFTILGTLLFALASIESWGETIAAPSTPTPLSQNSIYLGIFGGGGTFSAKSITQSATIFVDPPFSAYATGSGSTNSVGAVGGYIGYKLPRLLQNSPWTLTPSAELEGYYLNGTETGNNINDTSTQFGLHSFLISYPMDTGVFLVNTVLSVDHADSKIHPYIGLGLGAAILSISDATSFQTTPPEPGINHYNSDPNASAWTFAAQSKLGLRFNITVHTSIFAEYRFLYLAPTDYTFGSTQYPTHNQTSNWNVDLGNMCYNMSMIGIQYEL